MSAISTTYEDGGGRGRHQHVLPLHSKETERSRGSELLIVWRGTRLRPF